MYNTGFPDKFCAHYVNKYTYKICFKDVVNNLIVPF